MLGCNGSTKEPSIEINQLNSPHSQSNKQDSISVSSQEIDIVKINSQDKSVDTFKKPKKKTVQQKQSFARYIEFPSDNTFNGKPLTHQIEIAENVYKKFTDTLTNLALFNYKSYTNFFPKSISDNFEEGISTTHIHYPKKLIFRFQLFENEFSSSPYITKEITINRNVNGDLYAE